MAIRIAEIRDEVLRELFLPCKACAYWECPELFPGRDTEEQALIKREWYRETSARFGPCGKVLYMDDEPAAYCQYAPPRFVPGISGYPGLLPHLDSDGVLLTCLCVSEAHQRKGLGRMLLRDTIDEARARGFGVIQTFARNDSANNCSGPTAFYLAEGFVAVATEGYPNGGSFSLMRLDLGPCGAKEED